jgi:hypothetical protein
MFGLEFLFSAALWALPIVGLPLVLHLLFRQRSQVVYFSTLRFIQASIKENATRKKVQRWLLLACRALLLLLLILALAQPARKLTSGLFGGDGSTAAAIVVDTSYSMLLEDQKISLLQKEDDSVRDLLRTELRDADVAIFRSDPPATSSEAPRLQPAEAYRGDHWSKLTPTPSPVPLIDRVAAAAQMLADAGEDKKWLIVITDAQQKEFPRPLPQIAGGRTILIDLHPGDVRNAAITRIATDPPQPRLGIPAQIVVDLAGHPNETRQVTLQVAPVDQPSAGAAAASLPPLPLARFDNAGRAELRTPFSFTAGSWLLITANLTSTEPLPWAATRSELVRISPRQTTAVLSIGWPNPQTERLIRLALDPSEGAQTAWPIQVHAAPPKWDESMIVALLDQWPDQPTLDEMQKFVRAGGSLVLFVQPGLEDSWKTLDAVRQQSLSGLLPSPPQPPPAVGVIFHAGIVRPNDEILADIGSAPDAPARLVITRLMRFAPGDSQINAIINAVPSESDTGSASSGLLWSRRVGDGRVYTWATMPDRSCGNLRVWEIFPPSLVNAARSGAMQQKNVNIEPGQSLTIAASNVPDGAEVDIQPPGQEPVRVNRINDQYVFADTSALGVYAWQWRNAIGQTGALGWANVQPPAAEADLRYRPLKELAPDAANTLAAHSLDEVRQRLQAMEEPRPQWTTPIAVVLVLLCVEALLGALPRRRARNTTSTAAYVRAAESR